MNQSSRYELSEDASVEFETPDTQSHFFGYYDKSPFDSSGERLLAHRASFDGRKVKASDSAEVGYFDLDDESFHTLGTTQAFNWQQGSMLQWLPPDYDQRVIYNDREDDGFRSVIVDTETGEETVLSSPIYAIHPSGEFALTVNFERMVFCRSGYSYRGVESEKWDVPLHEDDGIFRVDLDSGETSRILGTREVCEFDWKPEFEERDNWLEHVMWNPSGTRIAFFHRWSDGDGGFTTRLYTADPDGSNLFEFPDTGLYSHMDWRDDERFTVWGIKPSGYQETERFVRDNVFLSTVAKPVYRFLKDRLVGSRMDEVLPERCFIDFRDQSQEFETLPSEVLTHDGHNTWRGDDRWMLTDTYPLEGDNQHLLLYDDQDETAHELGTFYSTAAHSAYKCDLHPRWDRDEERIVVDSAHKDRRQMVVIQQDLV